IRVFQGEREMAADNKVLGQFDLMGIPQAPRGVPQIEVTFDIDANGIVNVGAKDKATGKEQAIRIQASGGLSEDEIDNMVKEAESHAGDDKARKEMVELHNQADSLIYATEKNLKDYGDKIEEADKTQVETDIAALREVMESDDAEVIKAKVEALSQSAMKLGEAMYKAQQEGEAQPGDSPDAAGASSNAGDDATVVDADFEEVEDDKKDKSA
ncbi:MAG: Hsp70 family protein, partial [Proteobacteria bacterium]|nr:Hsp70 family protein [Pseudomonadota bacterium]